MLKTARLDEGLDEVQKRQWSDEHTAMFRGLASRRAMLKELQKPLNDNGRKQKTAADEEFEKQMFDARASGVVPVLSLDDHAVKNAIDIDLSQASEDELIDAMKHGSSEAFGIVADKYHNKLVEAMNAFLGDRHLSEDVAQEAFLKAFKKIDTFRGDSQFYTWLYRIAYNLAISFRRKGHVQRESFFAKDSDNNYVYDAVDDTSRPPQDIVKLAEIKTIIDQELAQLSEDHRTILVLREYEGMNYDQIAEALGIVEGTVRSRLHRARYELRTRLTRHGITLSG